MHGNTYQSQPHTKRCMHLCENAWKYVSNPNQGEVASGFPIDPPRQPQVLEEKNRYPRGQSADALKVSTETGLSRLSSLVAAISYDGSLPREDENTGEKDCMMDPLRGFTGREKYKRPSLVTDTLDKPSSLIRNVVKDLEFFSQE